MQLTNIKAVLWDMDGTLIHSERLHYEVIAWQCSREGFAWSWEDNKSIMGATMDEKWRLLNEHHRFATTKNAWLDEFNNEYKRRLSPDLGLHVQVETVRLLDNLELPMACVSNGEHAVVRANLEVLGIARCFQAVVANGDCHRGKPWPDPYLLACERLDVAPETCLAVEDSPIGARAALAAGLTTVVWPDGEPWEGPPVQHMVEGDRFPWELLGIEDVTEHSGLLGGQP